MPLLRIARGESVGILFGTPVHHKSHHAQGVLHNYMMAQVVANYGSPVSYYAVLVIPIRVSYAFLGYARNNSDALLARISPRTACKVTKLFLSLQIL